MAKSSMKTEQPIELQSYFTREKGNLYFWKDGAGTVWVESNSLLKLVYLSLIPIDPLKRVEEKNRRYFLVKDRTGRVDVKKKLLLNQQGVWQLIDNSHLSRLNKIKVLRYLAYFYRTYGVTTVEPECIYYTQGQCPWPLA
ncbi:MAG: hypothetical protein LUE89_07445 [Clostridiales bacterium]|nr:hypothetical protein [Clostridiales bacterium]